MMEAYITLVEVQGNRWELTVRLPNKWLHQFGHYAQVSVFGQSLGPTWGKPVYEDNAVQPWQYLQHVYCSLGKAEAAAAAIMSEMGLAKASLVPKGYVKYTLDLTPDAPLGPVEEKNVPGEDVKF